VILVATANVVLAAYLLAVEHTFRGPGLLIVLAVILIVVATGQTRRET
jgi:hypothetical protein